MMPTLVIVEDIANGKTIQMNPHTPTSVDDGTVDVIRSVDPVISKTPSCQQVC